MDFEHLQIVFFISVGKYNALSWVTISINYMYLNVPNNVKSIRVPGISIIYQPLWLLKFTNCFDTTSTSPPQNKKKIRNPLCTSLSWEKKIIKIQVHMSSKEMNFGPCFLLHDTFPHFLPLRVSAFDESSVGYIKEQVLELPHSPFSGRFQWQNVSSCLHSSMCLLVPRPGRIYSIPMAKL